MDYKESAVSGTSYTRFNNVSIKNPLGGKPTVTCSEQNVFNLGAKMATQDTRALDFDFNAGEVFPVLNPLTNVPTGDLMNGAAVYALVYSYVLHEATKRDVAEEAKRVADAARAAEIDAAVAAQIAAQLAYSLLPPIPMPIPTA